MKIEGINAGHLHKYLASKKIPLLSVRVHEDQPIELILDEDKIPPGKREEIIAKAYALVNAYPPGGSLKSLKMKKYLISLFCVLIVVSSAEAGILRKLTTPIRNTCGYFHDLVYMYSHLRDYTKYR